MTVYIEPTVLSIDEPEQEEGLIPCTLAGITDSGATLSGEGWSLGGYTGPLYADDGTPYTTEGLRMALLHEEMHALMNKLREAGELDELLSHSRLLDRLLDALETVPLLRTIIAKLRESDD